MTVFLMMFILNTCKDDLTGGSGFFPAQGGDFFQRIGNPQLLVFPFSHIVVGQDVQCLDIVQASDKMPQPVEKLLLVGNVGHNHMANPYRHGMFIQIPGKGQNRIQMLPGQYLMCLRIDMLDIQHNQIGGCGQTVKAPEPFRMLRSKGDAGGVQTGMRTE